MSHAGPPGEPSLAPSSSQLPQGMLLAPSTVAAAHGTRRSSMLPKENASSLSIDSLILGENAGGAGGGAGPPTRTASGLSAYTQGSSPRASVTSLPTLQPRQPRISIASRQCAPSASRALICWICYGLSAYIQGSSPRASVTYLPALQPRQPRISIASRQCAPSASR